jgi:hypothetical protein
LSASISKRVYLVCTLKNTEARNPDIYTPFPKISDLIIQLIHLDHLGHFIETPAKNKYVLVIVDGFSKFTQIRAVPDTSTQYAIQKLDELFAIFGTPRCIITNARKAFTSHNFRIYTETRGLKLFIAAVGLARGNGQVERVNKMLLDALATTSADTAPNNWNTKITQIQQGINSTKH